MRTTERILFIFIEKPADKPLKLRLSTIRNSSALMQLYPIQILNPPSGNISAPRML